MQEPSVRTSRLAIAVGLAVALAAGTAGFMIGRTAVPPPPPAPEAVATPAPAPEPERVASVVDRGALARLAGRAADAAASGAPYPEELAGLAGRRLSIALPFGCGGSAAEDSGEALSWRYDEAAGTLRVRVAPLLWPGQMWGGEAPVEGFWIPRPWSSADRCPVRGPAASVAGAEAVTLPGQTLAIGQPLAADTTEASRPYEAVVRLPAERARLEAGLRARLTGRVADDGSRRPIRCVQPGGPEQRPICLVTAQFDELVVENPATGETVARWTLGQPADPRR